jgi:hypothetical protein
MLCEVGLSVHLGGSLGIQTENQGLSGWKTRLKPSEFARARLPPLELDEKLWLLHASQQKKGWWRARAMVLALNTTMRRYDSNSRPLP